MSTNLKHFEHFGPAWNRQPVLVFAGQHDTRIKTGEDYDTRTLGSLFTLEPSDKTKGAGLAFIPSSYHDYDGREHRTQRERGVYVALTGDVDKGDIPLERIETLVRAFAADAAWLIYSSAHARPGSRRWRVIMPLDAPVSFDVWHDAQDAFYRFMENAGIAMDWALDRAAQPVYLPNVPAKHDKTGTALRGEDGAPLYYERNSSGTNAPGLRLDSGALAAGLAAIARQREADEREREQIRIEAERKRATRPQTANTDIIDDFNEGTSIETMLELCGYTRSPRNADDWRSPHQTGETFATRIIGRKWISLSGSDAASGLGDRHAAGCYGDAYDLFVHYDHKGDHKAAFRALHQERKARISGVPTVRAPEPPPLLDESCEPAGPIEAPLDGLEGTNAPDSLPPDGLTTAIETLGFDIREWSTDRFFGEAPPIRWLCENTIPLGVPALFAAMGGAGKSFIALDMALEIGCEIAFGTGRRILGGKVMERGSVVVLNAEDSKDSVHRRLERIDTGDRRANANGRVFVVPLPEVGGPRTLVAGGQGEVRSTDHFSALLAQLENIPDLKLVIIDPLQAFVSADVTKDPAAGQFMWSSFAQICARTGATVIVCHHMRKDGAFSIQTADQAREAIRGSTALIDGARATYALWGATEEDNRRICQEAGVDVKAKQVVHGAVVKSNDEHDFDIHTYLRNAAGLLVDASELGERVTQRGGGLSVNQALECLRKIDERWRKKKPFGVSYQARDRHVIPFIVREYGVTKQDAQSQLDAWFHGEMLEIAVVDPHSKLKGLRVSKWPE